jgi:hypothetical protein
MLAKRVCGAMLTTWEAVYDLAMTDPAAGGQERHDLDVLPGHTLPERSGMPCRRWCVSASPVSGAYRPVLSAYAGMAHPGLPVGRICTGLIPPGRHWHCRQGQCAAAQYV